MYIRTAVTQCHRKLIIGRKNNILHSTTHTKYNYLICIENNKVAIIIIIRVRIITQKVHIYSNETQVYPLQTKAARVQLAASTLISLKRRCTLSLVFSRGLQKKRGFKF